MTNAELSAKVAEVRDEGGCTKVDVIEDYDKPAKEAFRFLPPPKPYATDMNAAWELVDEMRKHVRNIQCETSEPKSNSDADLVYVMWGGVYTMQHASTMPRAICKAYIAWKECIND